MGPVSKDINYKDLLEQIEVDTLTFEIEHETGFIHSLISDGYTCFLKLRALDEDSLLTKCQCVVMISDIYTKNKQKAFKITFLRKTLSIYEITIEKYF